MVRRGGRLVGRGVWARAAARERIRGWRRSVGVEDGVEGVAASHHEVAVRFGHVAEAAVEDDGERDVVEGGVVGGRVSGADAAGVLAEGGVAAVVVAVLDLPVAAAFAPWRG